MGPVKRGSSYNPPASGSDRMKRGRGSREEGGRLGTKRAQAFNLLRLRFCSDLLPPRYHTYYLLLLPLLEH